MTSFLDLVDVTHGIERDPDSDAYGELVVPVIFLWNEPGGTDVPEASNLAGALAHDSAVVIKERREINGRLWCLVSGQVYYENDIYPQEGWCLASFLRDTGQRNE
jgi:hypothetical protein